MLQHLELMEIEDNSPVSPKCIWGALFEEASVLAFVFQPCIRHSCKNSLLFNGALVINACSIQAITQLPLFPFYTDHDEKHIFQTIVYYFTNRKHLASYGGLHKDSK